MTLERLIEEAHKLARPSVNLEPFGEDSQFAAVWGGKGIVGSEKRKRNHRHWISVDCRFLPPGFDGLTGVFSVYLSLGMDDWEESVVEWESDASLNRSSLNGGTPLFAQEALSLPNIDITLQLSSPDIQRWLVGRNWQPYWGFGDLPLEDQKLIFPFDDYLHERALAWKSDDDRSTYAALAGWQTGWAESTWDEYENKGMKLVLWTFKDSEPWIEVWWDGGQLHSVTRIT
ncbi:MAG: hypothetical protein SFU83_03185 [Meiothermus sp.]|nr:hypothetical protein [Meiothermus sp.]